MRPRYVIEVDILFKVNGQRIQDTAFGHGMGVIGELIDGRLAIYRAEGKKAKATITRLVVYDRHDPTLTQHARNAFIACDEKSRQLEEAEAKAPVLAGASIPERGHFSVADYLASHYRSMKKQRR